ncbi:DoxX family membrane protein [Mucilaginibacter aquaedulcis]|jgi:putative oxidoreductase|uniref:DoxX family membrane protein n=1 Tax=Mucilaginibacter aquaedulcis TaxID=1187081 RepID=UPI0025B597BC|nr:DoxX family membrane protein [Mucilaginibacter aquaedulcis]MDN3549736.1 DoxX family membrane protein [Mucilaginibacter aquaedulcis]
MKIAVLIARVLLGLIFVVFGLNFFFQFIPMTPPPMSAKAQAFSGGLWGSGYFFQYMKIIEIVSGLAILFNRYTAFFLLILFPISVNIFLFHLILAPYGVPIGTAVILLNLFLGLAYRKYYSGIFTAVPTL